MRFVLSLFAVSSLVHATDVCPPHVLEGVSAPNRVVVQSLSLVHPSKKGPLMPHDAALTVLAPLVRSLELMEGSGEPAVVERLPTVRKTRVELQKLLDLFEIPYDQYVLTCSKAYQAISGKPSPESAALLPVAGLQAFNLHSRIALALQGVYLFDQNLEDNGLSTFFQRIVNEIPSAQDRRHMLLALSYATEHQVFKIQFQPVEIRRTLAQLVLPFFASQLFTDANRTAAPFYDPTATEQRIQWAAWKLRTMMEQPAN